MEKYCNPLKENMYVKYNCRKGTHISSTFYILLQKISTKINITNIQFIYWKH